MDGVVKDEDDSTCLAKKSCKETEKVDQIKLTSCNHCGAKNWNILGDAKSGYVLSQGGAATCLIREGNKALTAPCDSPDHPYTPLQLQFASPADIETMSTVGARLVGAASEGNLDKVKELVKEGEVDARDWDKLTGLIGASSSGHLDICKFLLKAGANVNAQDKDGISALMEASIMGHAEVAKLLLDNGAEVDASAASGVTALWLASSEGKSETMKILLAKNADASNTRTDGISAVMTASIGGHSEAIKILLENGAEVTGTDKDGLTAMIHAAEKGDLETLKLLAAKAENDSEYTNAVSKTGFTALILASAHGHTEAVKFLVENGAGASVTSENNITALMYAASSNHTDSMRILVETGNAEIDTKHLNEGTALLESSTAGAVSAMSYLLEKGAEVDGFDKDGVTPLMAVASNGSVEGLELVLDYLKKKMSKSELTTHINLLSFSGGSAIMFAAAGGHLECAKILDGLGANANDIARATPDYLVRLEQMIADGTVANEEPHVDGVTALHVAAKGGHLETVEFLLGLGVDIDVKDEENRTPLTLAVNGNYGKVAIALVKAGADPNTEVIDKDGESRNIVFNSLLVENVELAKALLEKGADYSFADEKKVSVLLQASHRGFTDIVELILKRKPSKEYLDSASEEGVSPLVAAASEGHIEVVERLIKGGADVNFKDQDGTSAVMSAAARGHVKAVKLLIDAKARLNDQNKDGHTALMFAYNGKNQVETLWERYSQYTKESAEAGADDGETGPMLRDALDNHTAVVDLLIKSGADQSLKDKEGHAAKDFDFNPETDEGVLANEAKAEKARDSSKNEL